MTIIKSRPDLPCPWCRGKVRHVLGCPSPPLEDERWDRQKKAHAAAVSFGGSEYGMQLLHLVEKPKVAKDAQTLPKVAVLPPTRAR